MSETAQQPVALTDLAHEALIEEYGQSQDRRYVGYFKSQSLKRVLAKLDSPERVQEVAGKRRANQTTRDADAGRESLPYLDARDIQRDEWRVAYNRAHHPTLDWETLSDRLTANRAVWDIPVERLVVRLDDEDLHEHWRSFIETASARHPDLPEDGIQTNWIEPPFFAVMETARPGSEGCERAVRDYHDDEQYYFMPRSRADETHAGMGWNPRTLDLVAMWSHRAFVDTKDVLATRRSEDGTEKITPRVIEDEFINFRETDVRRVGGVNSPLFVNKWRRAFSRGSTDQKAYNWLDSGEWVQAGRSA